MEYLSHSRPLKRDFKWIRQQLDPQWSYVVIERERLPGESSLFEPTQMAYTRLEKWELVFQKVVDVTRSREYLVIRIPPGNEEKHFGSIMGCGFSGKIVYYLYKSEEA